MRFTITARLTVACLAVLTAGRVTLFAADGETKSPSTQPAAQGPAGMDPAVMMAAWQKFATPGPEHAMLAKWVGEWETTMEDLTPGMGNEKSAGTARCTMIMGGRYLHEEITGTAMGQPFEGLAITGFDNKRKEYFSNWIDTMGTGVATSWGTAAGQKMDFKGDMTCPLMDHPIATKTTITIDGNDRRVMEMTMTTAEGTPMGAMRVTYVRKK